VETPTKLAIGAAALLTLLAFGTRGRAQTRARPVTRGLVLGDSILAHGGAVNELKRRVGGQWTNLAVVGRNSAHALEQARTALTRQGHFSHVVVLTGVNDGDRPASFTKTNLTQIYQLAKSMGAQVIAVSETPFRGYSGWTSGAQTRQNAVVGFLVTQRGGGYADRVVDAWTQFSDTERPGYLAPRYAAPDGLHLNSDGQRFLGALIAQAIWR
jgi:lysophospholipase L1-like esterase